jgi:two-component system response regulator WspF
VRIAIVNDLVIAVEALRRVLLQAEGHELAWIARTGHEAVERCARDTPDLVLMDLIMPGLDGVEAIRRIMSNSPCAIVVVTGDMDRNVAKVFEAMGAGALDAVNTPTLRETESAAGAEALLRKIQTIQQLIGTTAKITRPALPAETEVPARPTLIVVGASAGGPAALAKILASLPEDFPAAMVIVQHVDSQFLSSLADWLSQQTKLRVRLAADGERPLAGLVLIAGQEAHLLLAGSGKLVYNVEPADSPYRPSIDIFFQSAQKNWRGRIIGVLLTGMGKDGANGLKCLHDAGCHTIIQDQATSAVYGMPKAAAQLDAATEVLPLEKIGPRLVRLLT